MAPNVKSSPYRGVTLFRPTMKWRAQISANGKTTSLGDHDTEEQAATAFDRAAINKAGRDAKTNFPMDRYTNEIEDLQGMDLVTLVAMLRTKARKSSTQTSHFRGVSLLKQTRRWHAQINVGGKQVHLGFFPTEEYAARSYDRAAINKAANEPCGKIVTNFDITDYSEEFDVLRRVSQEDLVFAFSTERKRRYLPASNPSQQVLSLASQPKVFVGNKAPSIIVSEKDRLAVKELLQKAERAQPKSTARNPLYQDFGLPKTEAAGSAAKVETEAGHTPVARTTATEAFAAGQSTENSGACISPMPASEEQNQAEPSQEVKTEPKTRNTEGFERLLAGVQLASLEEGPILELPLIHPLTGAPAKVAGPYSEEQRKDHSLVIPPQRLLASERAQANAVKPQVAAPRPVFRVPPQAPREAQGLKRGEGAVNLTLPVSMPAKETVGPLIQLIAKQPGWVMREPHGRPSPSMQDAAIPRQPSFAASPPMAQPAGPCTPPVSPSKPLKKGLAGKATEGYVRTPKRPRTQLRDGATRAEARNPWEGWEQRQFLSPTRTSRVSKEGLQQLNQMTPKTPLSGPPARADLERSTPLASPRLSLQERLWQVQEARPQQEHQDAPEPAALPSTPARPLTKRQEALAIRKTEEAAATLAAKLAPEATARRMSPLPEEVGEALMDFAEAAELAELEDKQLDEENKRARLNECLPHASSSRYWQITTQARDSEKEDLTCLRHEEPELQGSSQDRAGSSDGTTESPPSNTGRQVHT